MTWLDRLHFVLNWPREAANGAAIPALLPDQAPLTCLRGIGEPTARRLERAGYATVAALAEADPAIVRASLGAAGRIAKVESWIAEAQAQVRAHTPEA